MSLAPTPSPKLPTLLLECCRSWRVVAGLTFLALAQLATRLRGMFFLRGTKLLPPRRPLHRSKPAPSLRPLLVSEFRRSNPIPPTAPPRPSDRAGAATARLHGAARAGLLLQQLRQRRQQQQQRRQRRGRRRGARGSPRGMPGVRRGPGRERARRVHETRRGMRLRRGALLPAAGRMGGFGSTLRRSFALHVGELVVGVICDPLIFVRPSPPLALTPPSAAVVAAAVPDTSGRCTKDWHR